MNPKTKNYYLGIDFGATNFKYGILTDNHRLIKYRTINVEGIKEPQKAILFIKDIINQISKNYNLLALGFGLPGLVDYKKGYIHYLVNLGWRDIKWKKILERQLNLPIFLDNDVNVATLAEYYLGAGKGFKNMVMVTLGTGVGGGLVLSGKICRGANNLAGEIGHVPVALKGPTCNCGGKACLESYIGSKRLLAKAQNLLKKKLSLEELTTLAKMGDEFAINFWRDVADKLGLVLVGVINLLDPEIIVIGGGISNVGGFLFNPLRKFIRKRAMEIQAKNVKITRAKLGAKAGLIGAALLAKYTLEGRDF